MILKLSKPSLSSPSPKEKGAETVIKIKEKKIYGTE